MFNNYVLCKIFIFLFLSFLSFSCGVNNVNTGNNNNIVIRSSERFVDVKEGETFRFVFELNRVSTTDIIFDWYVQHISTSTSDFTGSLRGTKQIRAGDTTTTISIDTSDDSIYEGTEDFALSITNVIGAASNNLAASGSIIDNDSQPVIALLSFEQIDSTATEGASFTYRLELNRVSTTDIIFDWYVQHSSTSTSDFTGSLRGTKQIRAGDTTTTISIDTSDDSIYEGTEDFALSIANVRGAIPDSLFALGNIIDNDTQPSLVLLSFEQIDSTAIEGASFTYRLELDRASLADVSFDWSVQHYSTNTSDFTGALRGTKQIRAGDTTATISIDTSDDSIYETDEIFTLIITNVTGAILDNLFALGSIIDNEAQLTITFEQNYISLTEGASFTYNLQLNRASAADVSFDWSVQHSSTSTSDFTGALRGTQQIIAGDTTTTISIDTSDDSIYETDEIFTINIINVTGAIPDSLFALGNIIDNDPQPVITLLSFEQIDSTAIEGTSFTYNLQLNRASLADVSFDWSVQHSSTSTSDFTGSLRGTKQIRAGDTIATISIDTSDDSIYETDEIFTLSITNVIGAIANNLVTSSAIIDNDPQPVIALLSFEQIDSTATEGASFTYNLQLNRASLADVSFNWSVQHSSTSTSDFTGSLRGTKQIRAGDTTTTISIDTSDDSIYESTEDFALIITNVIGAIANNLATSSAIIDNDPQPVIALLSFEQVTSTATEGASFTYNLQLNRASLAGVSFDWSVQHSSTSTSDFTGSLRGTKQIRAGDTTTTISIDTSDDSIYESTEDFALSITNVIGAIANNLVTSSAIIDNDPQPVIALLSFEQIDSTATEGTSFTYRLELNRASAADVSFDWSVQHISTSTSDFTGSLRGTKQIRAGDTTTTISIDTSDDSIYESTEDFALSITNVIGAAPNNLVTSSAIIDNDPQPVIALLSFEQIDSTTTEGTSFTYRLELNRASAADVSFDWSVQHISTSTSDFTGALRGTKQIRAGDTTTTISIDTSDDSIYETDEIFTLSITNVIGAILDNLFALSSIIDNEAQLTITFEQNYISLTEGASFTYNLQLNRASAADVSFDWSVQHSSTSTSDFTGALRSSKQIRAGDTTTTISIDTSDDSIYETDEIFTLNIINVTGAIPDSLFALGNIIDNDPQPVITLLSFEQIDSTATEGASFTYNLQLNRASAADVSFDWSVQHISTSTSDFTGALRGTKQIRAGDTTTTISIDTSDDSIYESTEDFALIITNVIGAAPNNLVTSSAIIDNDSQPVITLLSFEQIDSTATEGASFTYRLELNRASLTDVSFDWSVQHSSTSTSDFTGVLRGTKQIRAGDTTTTISIDTSDDSIYETDEIFTLSITNVTGAILDNLFALGSIIDNEAQLTITFEQNYISLTEGASFTYNLQLNRASATDVSFDWSVQHSSTSTSDFTGILAGTKQIRAGDTTTTISIDTSDDSIYETDEIFTLSITNVIGAVPDSLFALGSIIDNDTQLMIAFEQGYSIATEGASLIYNLQLNRASLTDVSFDWFVQHSSTSTSDFTGSLRGTKQIRAGDTTTTISIDTSDDSIYETDEIFTLNIANVIGAVPNSLLAGGSILDNDTQLLIAFEQGYSIATEGASLIYNLQLNRASLADVSFDWSLQHSSTSTSDFRGIIAGSKQITAGDTTTTISIDTSDDSIYEIDEIFTLNITNIRGAAPDSLLAGGSILDNDTQLVIAFERVDTTATEGASFTYRLELNRASVTDVSFDWSVQHSSTSTSDFRGTIAGSTRIRTGDTTVTISIDTSDDSIYEGDEHFAFNIINITGAAPNNLVASSAIIDNDAQPTIAFERVDSTVTEGASFTYRLELNRASLADVSFDWSVQHSSTSTSDFTGATSGLNKIISAGDTTVTIVLQINDDDRPEQAEKFTLNITNIRGVTPDSLSTLITILENDIDTTADYNGNGLIDIVIQEQLGNIRYNLAGTSYKTSTSDAGKNCNGNACRGYELLANLDLSMFTNWQPIGSENDPFTSILQGNGYSIVNLVIDRGNNIGLFAALSGATIDNLVVEVASITGDSYVGALAGRAEQSAISKVQIRAANTNSKLSATGARVGGILGAMIQGTTITNVTSDLNVVKDNDNADNVGGIVGYVVGGVISYVTSNGSVFVSGSFVGSVGGLAGAMRSAIISYSSASGSVISSGSNNSDYGGLIGKIDGAGATISYSSASGSVTSNGANSYYYGGLVGRLIGRISYSRASGSMTSNGDNSNNYGGLIGFLNKQSTISYSSASSSMTSNGDNSDNYGGLVGYVSIDSTISDSSASGSMTSNGDNSARYGGLVGFLAKQSIISYSSASGGVTSNGDNSDRYGGLVGFLNRQSTISDSSASGSMTSNGDHSARYGGLVGELSNSAISYSSASASVTSNGDENSIYGGLVGELDKSTISDSSASGSVISNGDENAAYGGLVGRMRNNSAISTSSASGSVTSNEDNSDYYGGLVGYIISTSDISSSSASGSVSSSGVSSDYYGGLIGGLNNAIIRVSTSSASGSVTSNEDNSDYYGGLVGIVRLSSVIRYSSASGSVSASGVDSDYYGGLVGESDGEVQHSWSSGSVYAGNSAAGLVSLNTGNLGFSYALGAVPSSGFGLIAENTNRFSLRIGTVAHSYWNNETSGALEAADFIGASANIASSDTAGMLASTGFAGASVFAGFADATDEHNRNIWSFASGNYPVIRQLGVDEQAVALAYGLLRFAHPTTSDGLASFLGATLNNEDIELIANSYNANDTLAILDVNLLQSNSATCSAGSTDIIMTTTGANGTTIALQKIAGSIEIEKKAGNSCDIIFSNQKTDGTLQLAALISKGAASLSKKFEITLNTIQSRISLQPPTLSTREGDNLVFTLELSHRASRALSFDWFVQHISTSTSDFTGAIFGSKTILVEGTDATIVLQINDDNLPENFEDFALNITNIRGITSDSLSSLITILANDLTVDYNGNGLIDIVIQEHLDNIRYNLAGTSYKTSASDAGTNCGGSACRGYELLANLDLSAFANWQPIGSQNNPFTSILQGNGYSIANLVIDRGNNIGLFAALSGATIDNLVVEVASIAGDNNVGALAGRAEQSAISRVQIRAVNTNSKLQATGEKVGGMLGETIGTTITNATSDLSIVGGNNNDADYVGGIVGYVSSSDISYAYSSGSVSASGGVDYVGGLAGSVENNSTISYSGTSSSMTSNGGDSNRYGGLVGFLNKQSIIRYSSASGSMASNEDNSNNYGGLVGFLNKQSIIRYSSASVSVTSNGDNSDNYGGLVGYVNIDSTISDSSASASMTSNGGNSNRYGGLVGFLNKQSIISYSSASVSVASNGDDSDNYGGLVGFLNRQSTIRDSSASANVTSNGDNNDRYGGLVGFLNRQSIIRYSSASGSVTSSSSNNLYYGGLVGVSTSSDLSYSSASGSVTSSGSDNSYYGGLVGEAKYSSIRHSSASGNVIGTGNFIWFYGGFVGHMNDNSTINDSSASGNVSSSGSNNNYYGGLVGYVENNSAISYSVASGSVASSGRINDYYGGLVGYVENNSAINYTSASGNVSSNGNGSNNYGGLAGSVNTSSNINYTSASGNVSSNGNGSNNYGGLVGHVHNATINYSSASGSVISRDDNNDQYGGLVGESRGEVQHSWSSSSVFASSAAGLMGLNTGNLGFSYALGAVPSSGFGLIAENINRYSLRIGTVAHSYWNNETSGALEAVGTEGIVINIASSDTVGMLASTGSATARVFKGFLDATDELNRNIWSFASDSYPVITQLGVDEQAVSLAYGLLRLASPYVGVSNLGSFLGATLNNEDIELIANSYNANDTLAILDINLLQSNSATCAAGSGKTIMTTTGANGTTIALQKIAGSIEIEKSPSNSCDIIFSNSKTDGTLQLAALISKGAASLSKKFEITLNTIQSRIALQPPTLSTREGDNLVFTLELNHRASRALSFDWFVQHISTSTSDFTGAISGLKTILAKDTDATIVLQINDDNLPENFEDFTLNITNIRGVTPDSLSASITILENDLTVDYNGNGLIDIVIQEHLDNIRYNLAGTSYKTSASDAGKTCGGSACRGYELLADFDLSAFANWQPIGSQNDPFTSILQGNGYSIANLAIDGVDYLGLFAALSGATIDNLVIEVASISGDSYVGALAGRAEQSTISRVQIRAVDVNSKLLARGARVGGMLGETIGTTITNATSDLDVVGIGRFGLVGLGGIVGYAEDSNISHAYSSANVSVGNLINSVGGLVGFMTNSSLSYSSASGSVSGSGTNEHHGGLVGYMESSSVSYSSASSSVTSNGSDSLAYGGLVGRMKNNSTISYSSASGSVSSKGNRSDYYGGLAGHVNSSSTISYSSASGSVTSSGSNSDYYGGLVGYVENNSAISYSSASGSVISSGANSDYYGGLVGESDGEVQHSWSSSSVFASSAAGLVGLNSIHIGFSYALGVASYGLVVTNTGTIANNYWNSETSGALEAASANVVGTNIASSDTDGMLASTGFAGASVFADFADATDKLSRKIWSFVNGYYPVITEIGVDKQAVSLVYGLLRLAHPTATGGVSSFLGGTLNNENIELVANSYNANDTLAILDVNLLQSNSAICAAGSGDIIMTTTGANGTTIALQKIAGSIEIEKSPSNSCDIIFSNSKTDGTLQLAALISKGTTSLSKKFEITLKNIQPTIALHPTKASASEGDELIFTLELNHRARRDLSFDWYLQHSSTSVEDFRGATFGDKILFAGDTTTAITLEINDDDRPERAEDFTLHITNIRGATPGSFSTSITILASDLDITLDYDGNGLIDLVTQEQLGNIRHNLAGTSYKTSASDAGVKCGGSDCRGYELLADFDLSAFANWQPIGSQNDPFTSILQGNGYSIANLAIDGEDYLGLFAVLSGATIDNLVVEVASITGDSDVGALAGSAENSAISRVQIRAASVSSKLSATGARIGGILGRITDTTITNVTSDLDVVGIGGISLAGLGGIVGYAGDSSISHAYSSASVSAGNLFHSAGGLVGFMTNSRLSYSSASGSVSGGGTNEHHGGLVGYMESSSVSYSSASASVISSGQFGQNHGGLVGYMTNSSVSYSSASGSVIDIESYFSFFYGGLVGYATNSGKIIHSWSSSSVREVVRGSYVAGLIGYNEIDVKFNYVLGTILPSGFGLANTNSGTIKNSYWNSETSGALEAGPGSTTNIASSDTAGMLASTGSAEARIFKGFFDATDEHNRKIWTFTSGNYPVIAELGIDKQAVALAYGLLRLASPNVGASTLDSFLGGTLNHEAITLDANSYNANDALAILDVNLLQSNSATCATGSTDSIITTTGANQAVVTLSVTSATNNLQERIVYTGCNIGFDGAAVIQAGDRLQLVATITKGLASLTKKFIINFR